MFSFRLASSTDYFSVAKMIFNLKTLAAVAISISQVSAVSSLGFALGNKNVDGTCKYLADYEADLDTIRGGSEAVAIRAYSAEDCNTLQYLGPAVEEKGFKLVLSVRPLDESYYQAEKNALSEYLPQLSVSTLQFLSVGSEALYRDDLPASDLADKIRDMKEFLAGLTDKNGDSYSSVPVGTIDSWNVLVDASAAPAIEASDAVYANAFSYWQGQGPSNSTYSFFDDIMQALQVIQTIKGSTDIDFWVGETGWPTDGDNFGDAVPSIENADNFWKEAICGIRGWGINTFVFQAFDEDWKEEDDAVENHFGVWDSSRQLKLDSLGCDFSS